MEGYCTIRQAANIARRTVRTIREWIRSGKVRAVKGEHSGRWLVCVEDLQPKEAEARHDAD